MRNRASDCPPSYDALLLVSFGGPEHSDDVTPFLEHVAAGRRIPPERLHEVAQHYELFGGVSPINAQSHALLAAVIAELNAGGLPLSSPHPQPLSQTERGVVAGPPLTVYWGNRHWHPFLEDTVRQMADDGVRRALALATSAFGSYPGCRQYREDIERARQAVGPAAPPIDKLRLFYNHPGFVEAT
ncbi:MAG: ferrochelatase, partial [Thermoguttaceae bacterium]